MLQKIREKILGWVALVVIGLVGITFVFWGVTDLRPITEGTVAMVNGEEIPRREFEQLYQQQIMQFNQMFGGNVPADIQRELRDRTLDSLIEQRVLAQRIRERGYRVPDEWVAQSIRSVDAFHVGGQFSLEVYRSRLAGIGMTPDQFERQQRQGLAMDLLQDSIGESALYTSSEFRRYVELARQQRELTWARFSLEEFLPRVEEPAEQEMLAYYEANLEQFTRPEAVDLEYVDLHLDDVAGILVVDEDTLREYYQRTVVQEQGLEQRRARHVLISFDGRDPGEAQALAESLRTRIDEGADFAELAEEYSDDTGSAAAGGDLGWAERGIYVEPFEEALFSLSEGEIAGPVETAFGYHIIELHEIREPDVEPFEAVRDDLREQYLRDMAQGGFIDRANSLADAAFEYGDDLTAIAQAEGLEVRELSRYTRDGHPAFEDDTQVAAAAFSTQVLVEGRVSSLVQAGDEQVVLLRVVEHHPEQPYAFEEVADEIREHLRGEAAAQLAAEVAEQFLERLRESATAEELLEEFEVELVETARYGRQELDDVPPELLESAFAQPRPGEGEAIHQHMRLQDGDYAVYVLHEVTPGDPAAVEQFELDLERERLEMQAGFQDFALYLRALERNAEIRRPQEALEDFQF